MILFLLIFILGYLLANLISSSLSIFEKIGLGFPLGFGFITFIMFILNVCHLKFTYTNILWIILALDASLISFLVISKQFKTLGGGFNEELAKIKTLNIPWLFLTGLVVYILYVVSAKTLFWPTAAYDSVTGYDLMAKVSAIEGTFANSIFNPDYSFGSIRCTYPPYVSGSYALAYMTGLESSKISQVFIVLSLFFLFWATIRQYMHETIAILFTLIFLVVPELLAMSALSLSNVPQITFAAIGMIYLYQYIEKRESNRLVLAIVLLALNVWTRSDGVVFIFGGGIMLLFDAYRKYKFSVKNYWKTMLIYAVGTITPFLLWQIFLATYIPTSYSNSNVFVNTLFWDYDKFVGLFSLIWEVISSTQLYGITFILILVLLILNFKNTLVDKPTLGLGILTTLVTYIFIYYQMDNGSDKFGYSLGSMVKSSFKRGMFPFIPLLLFYVGTCMNVTRFSNWILKKKKIEKKRK
jgi:hypothetical protein